MGKHHFEREIKGSVAFSLGAFAIRAAEWTGDVRSRGDRPSSPVSQEVLAQCGRIFSTSTECQPSVIPLGQQS